ncbi:5-formyltetrahydrofolate cyclo-ligase [Paenibacillus protaetiae]|uniref:5-formyltetrahydrofolate cyclo-ligase n=1 Tax=Paenibacillus protaetiae TaxID=2509456 RepID=A0A4P6EYL2_9BACL|nr:5-formyltetrahydrofolate cyclo-ligase [Paenibacillus protaetiae]QAY66879.1 5-formyltetrahydrofolate cyclo-ligase [Paenibacillus protaetiae]
MDNTIIKNELRKRFTEKRNALSAYERTLRSEAACRQAAVWLQSVGASSVMAYVPFRTELDTKPLIQWCWETKVQVIVPRSNPEDRSMELYELTGWDGLELGAYGIMEPSPDTNKAVREWPDVIFVPGLAFDRDGGRLGYGGGYYDRLAVRTDLSSPRGSTCWIGLGYQLQLSQEALPMEAHDKRIGGVATEEGIKLFTAKHDRN